MIDRGPVDVEVRVAAWLALVLVLAIITLAVVSA